MEEAISQRVACSPGYSRRLDEYLRRECPDEYSLKFFRGSYFDNRRSFQRLFDMNNYFFQTVEYDRFKIKCQDIGIFDLQFPNPKGQGAVTDGSRFIFIDVYNFIERVHILLEDSLAVHEIERQIKVIFSILFVRAAVIQWTIELTNDICNMLYSDKLVIMICTLRRRFTSN